MKKLAIIILVGLMTLSCSEDSMDIPEPSGEFINRAGGYVFTVNRPSHSIYMDFRDGTNVVARNSYLDNATGTILHDCIDASYTIIEQSNNHIVMDIKWDWRSNKNHYEISIELDQSFSNPPAGYVITKNMKVFNDKREALVGGSLTTKCD